MTAVVANGDGWRTIICRRRSVVTARRPVVIRGGACDVNRLRISVRARAGDITCGRIGRLTGRSRDPIGIGTVLDLAELVGAAELGQGEQKCRGEKAEDDAFHIDIDVRSPRKVQKSEKCNVRSN